MSFTYIQFLTEWRVKAAWIQREEKHTKSHQIPPYDAYILSLFRMIVA
jgi:hypothetical protein